MGRHPPALVRAAGEEEARVVARTVGHTLLLGTVLPEGGLAGLAVLYGDVTGAGIVGRGRDLPGGALGARAPAGPPAAHQGAGHAACVRACHRPSLTPRGELVL